MTCIKLALKRFEVGECELNRELYLDWCNNCQLVWDRLWEEPGLSPSMPVRVLLALNPCERETVDVR